MIKNYLHNFHDFINEASIPEPPKPKLNPNYFHPKIHKFDIDSLYWNGDETYDYLGDIKLTNSTFKTFEELGLPIIRKVHGNFEIGPNSYLQSLHGGPRIVEEDFDIADCPLLISMEGCPDLIEGNIIMAGCISLVSHQINGTSSNSQIFANENVFSHIEIVKETGSSLMFVDPEVFIRSYKWLYDDRAKEKIVRIVQMLDMYTEKFDRVLQSHGLYDAFHQYDDVSQDAEDLGWD